MLMSRSMLARGNFDGCGCALHVVCCMLSAACIACCVLPAACCMLHVVCRVLPAAYCMLHVVCCVLPAACCMLHGAPTSPEPHALALSLHEVDVGLRHLFASGQQYVVAGQPSPSCTKRC
jgi:hypothetical protein